MGKKNLKSEYNDFLDGEKLRDNSDVRTSLQGPNRGISPPPTRQERKGKGKRGKGGSKTPQLTHFLCLPLLDETTRPQLQASLGRLGQELAQSGLVPLKAVRPVGTLHLTLGVMSLNADELEHAIQCLQDMDLESLLRDVSAQLVAEKAAADGLVAENLTAAVLPDTKALSIELKGLVPMQRPAQTSILYAEPADGGRLYAFGSELRSRFLDGGFLVEDKRPLKLHATIINTIYAKPKVRGGRARALSGRDKGLEQKAHLDEVAELAEQDNDGASSSDEAREATEPSTGQVDGLSTGGTEGHGPSAKGWRNFDARELIERYKDVVWARDVKIDRVQICRMGARKIIEEDGEIVDEEYEVVAEKAIAA